MSVTDGKLQAPSEVANTGQLIDQSQITRADGSNVIRQRVNLSDPSDPSLHAGVDESGGLLTALTGANVDLTHELLYRILSELRELNHKPPLRGCSKK